MRGKPDPQRALFYVIDVEDRIRDDHPLRPLKRMIDEELRAMHHLFDAAYPDVGRPSIPPERILKAMLLMMLYSIRSERQLVERCDTDLLFRWFLDMSPEEPMFDATAFTHNRPRLHEHGLVQAFFEGVVQRAFDAGLCSEDHFSVDGTVIEAAASIKSFRPIPADEDEPDGAGTDGAGTGAAAVRSDSNAFKSRNALVDFHGEKRGNATHRSTTDPEARLYGKTNGRASKLSHTAHQIVENRNGLIVAITVDEANGTAEPRAALAMTRDLVRRGIQPATLGADKGYDGGEYLLELERERVTPHSAVRAGTIGGKRVRKQDAAKVAARQRMRDRMATEEYAVSQRCRKKVEEPFGWLKTIAGLARTKLIGRWKLNMQLQLGAAAYNLLRMRKLQPT